ncbi:hypothetical protein [Microbacterium sp. NPDC087868]|uniref:hypothetical protein n=1 Tax=Microbacterium sp. NPDC087868 TaxID=3364195 RepID=UPI00384A8A65
MNFDETVATLGILASCLAFLSMIAVPLLGKHVPRFADLAVITQWVLAIASVLVAGISIGQLSNGDVTLGVSLGINTVILVVIGFVALLLAALVLDVTRPRKRTVSCDCAKDAA